jgi:hypothetical protein
MGKYKNREWYIQLRDEQLEKFGDVSPPWICCSNYHPYSMGWRMGTGETHIMVLNEWLDEKKFNFDERLNYLKKYPAPPRWYAWIISFLLEIDTIEFEEEDYFPYLEKLKALGFKKTDEFIEDLERDDLD